MPGQTSGPGMQYWVFSTNSDPHKFKKPTCILACGVDILCTRKLHFKLTHLKTLISFLFLRNG